jgi:hypothetical protein
VSFNFVKQFFIHINVGDRSVTGPAMIREKQFGSTGYFLE